MYAQSPSQCTYSCFLGDSTQLGNRTENSVVKRSHCSSCFKGRFDCVVGCLRPSSTAFMLNTPHCSHTHTHTHTHASWVNRPIYAIGMKTVRYKEPLLILFSRVTVIALLGFIGHFQQHLCPITLTVHKLMGPGRINPAMR